MSSTEKLGRSTTRNPSATGDTGFVGLVRRHPLTTFLVWFFTVGQAFAFAPVVARANGVELLVQPFILASTLIGLLLPAVVITRIVDGPERVRASCGGAPSRCGCRCGGTPWRSSRCPRWRPR